MGARGPIRKADGVRTLRGEYPPAITPADGTGGELKPAAGMDPAVRREYRRLHRMLSEPPSVLSKRDHDALMDLAQCLVRLRQAERDVDERGLIVDTPQGPKRNPSLTTCREYRAALQQWAVKFGLTPDARARMNLPSNTDGLEDEFGLLD